MKKTWSILLTLVLSVGLLAGCGNNDKSTDSGAANGGSEGSQDKKRIALVLPEKIGVNPFFALM
ncbi:BMP family ABC transporter substrate-binding protein, partial [Clostridium perfringens]